MRKIGLAVLLAAGLAVRAEAADVTLKISHFLPPSTAGQKQVLEPWCGKLESESKGRIRCQFYPAMQLGGRPAQLVDQAANGIADVVWTAPSYSTGRFPILEALELPFVMPEGGLSGSRAMWEFYKSYATQELANYKVLAVHSGGGLMMNTAKKPALRLADFTGIKIRTPSRVTSELLAALGGTPIAMPAGQVTEAVSKGVVDGAMGPWDMLVATKLDEVTKFHVQPPVREPALSAVALVVLMNRQAYGALPADLKSVIDRNSGDALVELFGSVWDRTASEERERALKLGNKIERMTSADYSAMREAAAGVERKWIKETEPRLSNAANIAAEARRLGAKYLNQ